MKMTIRINHRADGGQRIVRSFARTFVVAIILSGAGCISPQSVSLEAPPTVTRALAKRDLGIDYLSSRRTAMAIRELEASLQLDPSDPQTHLWLGESYRRKGRTEEAEAYLLDAIELSASAEDTTSRQSARLTLSALLSQMGRYQDSLEHCDALTDDPTFPTPWRSLTNCGWARLQLGQFEEARSDFDEALDFFPRFGPALLNMGILRTQQGHPLAAIKMLERALGSGRLGKSALGETHFRLGEIYVGLGNRNKAVDHFKEATVKTPYEDWGTQSQAYLDLLR